MADAEKKTLERIGKLHAKLRELQAQSFEVTEEIGRLLAGDIGIGDILKGLERDLSARWSTRYRTDYIWQYIKDRPNMKRLLKTLSPEEIRIRWAAYLRDDEDYVVKARHPFALFCSSINRYAEQGHATTLEDIFQAPLDCRHTPTCKTDQEHTRRRMSDMRTDKPVSGAML